MARRSHHRSGRPVRGAHPNIYRTIEGVLQTPIVKTASYNTPGFDLGEGTSPGQPGFPIRAILTVTNRDDTTGDETYICTLYGSEDDISYQPISAPFVINAIGEFVFGGMQRFRYVRGAFTLSGTTPILNFSLSVRLAFVDPTL